MKKTYFPYILIAILVIWSIVLTIVAFGNIDNGDAEVVNENIVNGFSTDFTKIVEDKKSSIVSINCDGTISSGFIYKQIDNKVYIVTSYHGVNNGIIDVSFGNIYSDYAELIGKDIYTDLAVIAIHSDYNIEPLTMGDSTLLKDGEFVISIGTPVSLDYEGSVELGMISSSTRVIENSITVNNVTSNYFLDVIQLSSDLKPGYSGSPILNMNGEVVGMVTMSLDDEVTFAITANEVKLVADSIINGTGLNKYQTGIKGTFVKDMPTYVKSNLNLQLEQLSGLYVEKVLKGSIGDLGEIKAGDVLLSINGTEITDLNSYLNVLYTKTDVYEFKVLRDSSTLTLTVHIND